MIVSKKATLAPDDRSRTYVVSDIKLTVALDATPFRLGYTDMLRGVEPLKKMGS